MTDLRAIIHSEDYSFDEKIVTTLNQLGMPCDKAGFQMVKTIMRGFQLHKISIKDNTAVWLDYAGQVHNKTKSQVDRVIRYAIEIGFIIGDIELWQDLFRFTFNSTNGSVHVRTFLVRLWSFLNKDEI